MHSTLTCGAAVPAKLLALGEQSSDKMLRTVLSVTCIATPLSPAPFVQCPVTVLVYT